MTGRVRLRLLQLKRQVEPGEHRDAITRLNFSRVTHLAHGLVHTLRGGAHHMFVAVAAGKTEVQGFVIDMNRAFEDFVVSALADSIGRRDASLRLVHGARGRGLTLDEAGSIRLEPDVKIGRAHV